jgi:hypothetical protein
VKTKGRNANFAAPCASALELEGKILNRSVRGQQNPTLVFEREGKYEKMKLFPAVS